MSEEKQLKFIRLKDSLDDVVGLVTSHEKHITIEKPLFVMVDTIFDEGRQILSMREYIPQSIVDIREVDFKKTEILFSLPVREEFRDQYDQVATFFYDENTSLSEKPKKKKKLQVDSENVISLLEALKDKKDKPVHCGYYDCYS